VETHWLQFPLHAPAPRTGLAQSMTAGHAFVAAVGAFVGGLAAGDGGARTARGARVGAKVAGAVRILLLLLLLLLLIIIIIIINVLLVMGPSGP
jgi:hypothetical protein